MADRVDVELVAWSPADRFDSGASTTSKESNRLEDVEKGAVHQLDEVAIRNGHAMPRSKTRRALLEAAGRYVRFRARNDGRRAPMGDLSACRWFVERAAGQ